MNSTSPAPDDASQPSDVSRLGRSPKRELIYGAIGFVTGFIVLPLMIYIVGTVLLGPYAGGKSVWAFYGEFYRNLIQVAPRTWFIALSPYLAIWLVRLSLRRSLFGKSQTPPAPEEPSARPTAAPPRRDPFISA